MLQWLQSGDAVFPSLSCLLLFTQFFTICPELRKRLKCFNCMCSKWILLFKRSPQYFYPKARCIFFWACWTVQPLVLKPPSGFVLSCYCFHEFPSPILFLQNCKSSGTGPVKVHCILCPGGCSQSLMHPVVSLVFRKSAALHFGCYLHFPLVAGDCPCYG